MVLEFALSSVTFSHNNNNTTLANPRGTRNVCSPCPISFIFMQFLTKFFINNRFLAQTQGLAPPSGKSWIRHCTGFKGDFSCTEIAHPCFQIYSVFNNNIFF